MQWHLRPLDQGESFKKCEKCFNIEKGKFLTLKPFFRIPKEYTYRAFRVQVWVYNTDQPSKIREDRVPLLRVEESSVCESNSFMSERKIQKWSEIFFMKIFLGKGSCLVKIMLDIIAMYIYFRSIQIFSRFCLLQISVAVILRIVLGDPF